MADAPRPIQSYKTPPRFPEQVRTGLIEGLGIEDIAVSHSVPAATVRFIAECFRQAGSIPEIVAARLDHQRAQK